jgi:hypothetical protein
MPYGLGAIFLIVNYFRLNHSKKVSRSFTLILIVLIFNFTFAILPQYGIIRLVGIILNIIIAFIFSDDQKSLFQKYIKDGGSRASNWILLIIPVVYSVFSL